MNGLCYLATPYTKFEPGIEAAFEAACLLAGRLLKAGVRCYSPIAHGHAIATHAKIDPLDHSIWLPFDELMLEAAGVLLVAHMPGWQESKGIDHEIKFFERAGKPVWDLDPISLRMVPARRRAATYSHDRAR